MPTKKELLEENDELREKLVAIRAEIDEVLEDDDPETQETDIDREEEADQD